MFFNARGNNFDLQNDFVPLVLRDWFVEFLWVKVFRLLDLNSEMLPTLLIL